MSGKSRFNPGKSYRLLHYLNRQHSSPERALLATLGCAGAMVVTGRSTLARQLAREFWQDNFKDGLRRAHWYATRGWPGLGSPESDPFFCFSDGLSLSESRLVLAWVERRAEKLPSLETSNARLVALAQIVHQAVKSGDQSSAENALSSFQIQVDELLAALTERRQQPEAASGPGDPAQSSSERSGDFASADAEVALKDVATLLPLEKWHWTALSGTFLGIFRENDFLPHDFDIDLGLLAAQTDVETLQQRLRNSSDFESVGLSEQYRLHRKEDGLTIESLPVLVKAVHRNGIAVDFSLLYQENGVWWHGSMMHRWDHAPMDLISYELRGVSILGPRNGDRYLTEVYGDWRTPVKEFNCSSGRRNLVVVQNLLGVCLFLKRLTWHLGQGDVEGYDEVLEELVQQSVLIKSTDSEGTPQWTMNRRWP